MQEMLADSLHGRIRYNYHFGIIEYWDEFWALMDSVPMQSRQEYTDNEFCKSLENYRNQSIQDSIQSKIHWKGCLLF